jgi:neurofibromin 1
MLLEVALIVRVRRPIAARSNVLRASVVIFRGNLPLNTTPFRKLTITQEKHVQWKNLTLFLATFGGVCVQEDYDPSALTSVIPPQHLPDELHVQDPMAMVSTFINDLTDLLIAESTQVREVARDALGNELSPRLYGKLFRHLEELVITNRSFLAITYLLNVPE